MRINGRYGSRVDSLEIHTTKTSSGVLGGLGRDQDFDYQEEAMSSSKEEGYSPASESVSNTPAHNAEPKAAHLPSH